ncbi:carbohydrate-binding module family 21 protein, partial [Hydnum rufescens UP504]
HVRLEDLFLSDDARCVRGLVIVRNLAFVKWVAARFTMDRWQTTSEVTARYVGSLQDGAYDRFEFNIRLIDYLSKIWDRTLHLAIRYSCEGHAESWDSNSGQNYIVVFRRKNIKKTRVAQDTDEEDEDHVR